MKRIYGLVVIMFILSSCRIFYPDRLFRAKHSDLVKADTVKTASEYVIRPGDLLTVGVFSNNGYELVDVLGRDNTSFSPLQYVVKESGYILLPMLDSVFITGMTITEAEHDLAKKYSYYFVNPFIRIEVTNRNVYVFKGRQGSTVVTLDHENMNLIEVISKAGGVPAGGKAYQVRLLRGSLKHPMVFDIDLSSIKGLQNANLTMEANDIVYIETRLTSSDVIYQITPLFTIISSLLLLTTTYFAITKK